MNKHITFLILVLTLSFTSNAQYKERPLPIDLSATLSYDQFKEIKQFVLDKGFTKTYGRVYKDNPYYKFGDIELF